MLVLANIVEETLLELLTAIRNRKDMKELFFNDGSIYFRNDCRAIQYVSMLNNQIIGYFQACVDPDIKRVGNVVWVKLSNLNNMMFYKDFYKFLYDKLIISFGLNSITWTGIAGGVNEKMYDKLIKKLNGKIIGIEEAAVTLNDKNKYSIKRYEATRYGIEQSSFIKILRNVSSLR